MILALGVVGGIILAEETYDNILQKVFLYLRDAQVHKLQGVEECGLHWESYFSRKDIRELFVELGVSITHHVSKRKNSCYKEIFVLDII